MPLYQDHRTLVEAMREQARIRRVILESDRLADQLDAAAAAIVELQGCLDVVERARPHWAQGWSSDSIAAQVSTAALSELWELLGVNNQTDAVMRLKGAKV